MPEHAARGAFLHTDLWLWGQLDSSCVSTPRLLQPCIANAPVNYTDLHNGSGLCNVTSCRWVSRADVSKERSSVVKGIPVQEDRISITSK